MPIEDKWLKLADISHEFGLSLNDLAQIVSKLVELTDDFNNCNETTSDVENTEDTKFLRYDNIMGF